MKRCNRCIIPETAKGIRIDDNGLCQLCRDFKKIPPKGEDVLRKEIDGYINKHSEFNCVVPVSGGRDSAYALYFAKYILGLKPIAVHSDNDFETAIARENLENMTKISNVPLIQVSSKDQLVKKIVVEKFKINAPFGPALVVDQTCEACKYGFESASYNAARKHNIQLVIWGDSKEESTAPYHSLFEHKVPSKWQRLFSQESLNFFKYKYFFSKLKREYGSDSPEGLKEIHLYDYIEWDRKVIVETIQNKLGWSKSKDSATSWRIDCSLVPLVNYLTIKAYGVSKLELGFSSMIRGGKMDRDDALRQVSEIENKMNRDDQIDFLRELNISSSCIDKILR